MADINPTTSVNHFNVNGLNTPHKKTDYYIGSKHKSQSYILYKKSTLGTSLVVQWVRLCISTAGGMGSNPSQGIKIPHAIWCNQKLINFKKEIHFKYKDKYNE